MRRGALATSTPSSKLSVQYLYVEYTVVLRVHVFITMRLPCL